MKNLLAAVKAGDVRSLDIFLARRGGCTIQECFELRGALDARPEYQELNSQIEQLDSTLDALEEKIDAREESLEELAELDEALDGMRGEIDALDETFQSLKRELYELKRPIVAVINGYLRRASNFTEASFKYVDPEVHALRKEGNIIDAQTLKQTLRKKARAEKKAGLLGPTRAKILIQKPWSPHKLRGMPLAQLLNIIAVERALRPKGAGETRALNELELFLMGKAGYSPILRVPKEWDRLWRIWSGRNQAK